MGQANQRSEDTISDLWRAVTEKKKLPQSPLSRDGNEEYQFFLRQAKQSWDNMVACYKSPAVHVMDHSRTALFMYDAATTGQIEIDVMMQDFGMFPRQAKLDILSAPLSVWTLVKAGYPADKMFDRIMSGDFTPADKIALLTVPTTRATFIRDGVKSEQEYIEILEKLEQEKTPWQGCLRLVK